MRSLSILVLLAGALSLASNAAAADLELGKTVYAKKCAMCHGPDGKGNAKMAAMLKATIPDLANAAAMPDSELVKLVADGKKPMPSFSKSLSKGEMDAVVQYAKSLGAGRTAGK